MKSKSKRGPLRFPLSLLHYGNTYYIQRIEALEEALKKRPRQMQIDLLGEGEIPADWALLIRSVLLERSPKTQIITNARSSLQNGSVLVWLMGDCRIIRADARVYFRRAEDSDGEATDKIWKEGDLKFSEADPEVDPEEADYAKVLALINEFLPVKELAGQPIEVPVLRQFGLVDNAKLDDFLASVFGRQKERGTETADQSKPNRVGAKSKTSPSEQARK
jgi:hypothetical protein